MNKSNYQDEQVQQIKDMLDDIVKQANDLRDNGYNVLEQSTGAVAAGIARAQKQAVTDLDRLKNDRASLRGEEASGWQKIEDNFHNFFAKSRIHHDERVIKKDIESAVKHANKADDNAANAVQHALTAMKAAEVALLDDMQAWAYADELNADMTA